jgi:AraC family transcriptional regulator, regulatory protein of adaptative response / DNA-3-methyladenine glycosylase II
MQAVGYTPPFDWDGLIAWLGARAIAGVEHVTPDAYARGRAVVRHDPERASLLVETVPPGEYLGTSVPRYLGPGALLPRYRGTEVPRYLPLRVRALFDTAANPPEIANVLARDRMLGPLLRRRPGIRVPGAWDPFELAVRAIVGQQVSVAGARTLLGRIAASHGFSPSVLAEVTLSGMPQRRAETIRTLARKVVLKEVMLERSSSLDESIRALCAIPGIGPWTAHYIAMRALREPDAFPAGDLILRRRAGNLTERELLRRAEAWRPFRAYAAMLLWTSA